LRSPSRTDWPRALRRYLATLTIGNLAWETAQLPLYTIWSTGTAREKAFAVVHCTAGDALIGLVSLGLALMAIGDANWPARGFARVLLASVAIGLGYTAFSEWLNLVVRQSWAYSESMPVVPVLGTGLSPVLQWLVIPSLALVAARRVGSPR
jgi:hypothetical protein